MVAKEYFPQVDDLPDPLERLRHLDVDAVIATLARQLGQLLESARGIKGSSSHILDKTTPSDR